jgi:hypothetical protein
MKQCTVCNSVLPVTEFYKHTTSKNGILACCKKCHSLKIDRKKQNDWAAEYAKTVKGRAKRLRNSAKKRYYGLEPEITQEWLEEKLKKGVCEFTGLPFDFNPSTEFFKNPYAPSLDRIDSKNKCYTPENTRVVLSLVNLALNEFGEKAAAPIIKAMAAKMEQL